MSKYADILDLIHWVAGDLPEDMPITVLDFVVLSEGHKVEFISFNPDESMVYTHLQRMHARTHGKTYEPKNLSTWHLRFWCDCQNRNTPMMTPHRAKERDISFLFNALREWALTNPEPGFICANSEEPSEEEEESCEGP